MRNARRWAAVLVVGVAGSIVAAPSAEATFPGVNGPIAFARFGDGGWEESSLRTIHADGSAGGVLWPSHDLIGTHLNKAAPYEVDWSPDASMTAYVATGETLGGDRLLVGDPTTGDRTVILRMQRFNDHAFIASVAFAPDGDSIAFCSVDIGGPHNFARLFTIGVDGSAPALVADRALCLADWSSDGRLVAVAGGKLARLVTLNADGSSETTIVPSSGGGLDLASPSWSPDGSKVVYAGPAGLYTDLFTVPATGGTPVRVTHTGRVNEVFPLFSPDGTKIAFSRTTEYWSDQSDLFLADAGGGSVSRLTDTPTFAEFTRSWAAT